MSQQPFNFKRGTIDELVSYCVRRSATTVYYKNYLLPDNFNFTLLGDYVLLTESIYVHALTQVHWGKYNSSLCEIFNTQSRHAASMDATVARTKRGNYIELGVLCAKETKKLMLNEDKSIVLNKVGRDFSTFNAFLRLISRKEFDLLLSEMHEMLSEHQFKIPLAELDGFVKGCVFFDGYVNIKLHQDNLKEQIKLVLINDKYTFTNKVQHGWIRENLA